MPSRPSPSQSQDRDTNLTTRPSPLALLKFVAIAAIVGVALSLLISLIQVLLIVDTKSIYLGLDGLRLPLAVATLFVGAGSFLVLWKRPSWKITLGLIAALAMLGIGVAKCVRVDSFYGNMVPRLAWRWTPEHTENYSDFTVLPTAAVNSTTEDSSTVSASTHDFVGFLGKGRDGVIANKLLGQDWATAEPRPLWRKDVGPGWGGFVAFGDYAVTQEQRGEFETVVAYDLATGSELWVHADPVRFHDEHGDGPRATPTFADGNVYTMGATGILNCLDARTGTLLWQQQTLEDPKRNNLLWGMSGSPWVGDGLVVVSPGGGAGQSLKAYDAQTGDAVWSQGDDPTAYASPIRADVAGHSLFLSFNGAGLRAHADDGTPLWLFPWLTQGEKQRVNVAQPIVLPETESSGFSRILISSGYGMGAVLLRVTFADGEWLVDELWHSTALKSKMSNFVCHDEYAYGFDNGIFACIRLTDGKRMWKRGRYGHGQVLLVNDTLLVQSETGEVVLLEATPDQHREVATLEGLAEKTWNNACLAGNKLLLRNDRVALCLEVGRQP